MDTLGHRLQVCAYTHGMTVKRHDAIVQCLKRQCERIGRKVLVEPRIPVPGGTFRKPDLIIYQPPDGAALVPEAWVVDVTVVADNCPDLDVKHFAKVNKYATVSAVQDFATQVSGCSKIRFSSLVLNWRGILAPASLNDMRELGLSTQDCEYIACLTLMRGAATYRMSNAQKGRSQYPRGATG